jgi:arginyl-tRNA synthetase
MIEDPTDASLLESERLTQPEQPAHALDALKATNAGLAEEAITLRTSKETAAALATLPSFESYPVQAREAALKSAVATTLESYGLAPEDIKLASAPSHVKGDVSIQLPSLLIRKEGEDKRTPMRRYMKEIIPKLAAELEAQLPFPVKLHRAGIYLNVEFDQPALENDILATVEAMGSDYGNSDSLGSERVVIDFSSPNIAKTMHVGHLRSTLIGQVLINLLEANGAITYGINHLGDWGTQFGQLVSAHRRWADEVRTTIDPEKDPVAFLAELYKRVKQAIKAEETAGESELANEGRANFSGLENGDPEIINLWKEFRRLSLIEFERLYKRLGVEFDMYLGESFYQDDMGDPVREALEQGIATRDEEGTVLVDFSEGADTGGRRNVGLLQKKDGASLYLTRDLAAMRKRKDLFGANRALYVIGNEQQNHMSQLFEISRLLGDIEEGEGVHVNFGLMLKNGEKISSREGAGGLEGLLDELTQSALSGLEARYGAEADPEELREAAQAIGVGALFYQNFTQGRQRDMEFDPESMLNLQNQSGPYLQYAVVRVKRLMEALAVDEEPAPFSTEFLSSMPKEFHAIFSLLGDFPGILATSAASFNPHTLADYLYKLASLSNKAYSLNSPDFPRYKNMPQAQQAAYRRIFSSVSLVLEKGLNLLNIQVPTRM